MNYEDFLKRKELVFENIGFNLDREYLNDKLFEYQKI